MTPTRTAVRLRTALLLLALAAPVYAADDPQILFVHLHYKDGAYTLVKTNAVPGTLKERRGALDEGAMQFEAKTAAGATAASGTIADPLIRRVCYPDPQNPGQMKNHIVKLDEASVVVRVPYSKDLKSLDLYRAAPQNVGGLRNAAGGRVLAGSIDLTEKGAAK